MDSVTSSKNNAHRLVSQCDTDTPFNLTQLKEEIFNYINNFPFDKFDQLSLTHRSPFEQSPYEGTGSLYNYEKKEWLARESDFLYFTNDLKGTILEQVFKLFKKVSNSSSGRMRIMRLPSKKCYSLHQDDGVRYHIALQTNPQSFLIFYNGGFFHIPEDGNIYYTNTLKKHTAMNGGSTDRIHLVFSVN